MKRLTMLMIAVFVQIIAIDAHAKISDAVWQAVEAAYKPAAWNEGLETAYVNPDPAKFRFFVVVLAGGLAAERGRRYITWAEYDYRNVTIDLANETVKNRRGGIYTYLQPGDVMAVAKLERLGNKIYMRLISPDVYRPANRAGDKQFSRVTNLVTFKLSGDMADSEDPAAVLEAMAKWVRPCADIRSAVAFASTIGAPPTQSLSSDGLPASHDVPGRVFTPTSSTPPGVKFTDPRYGR